MKKTKQRRKLIILNTSIWRIFAYFIIYSFLGYVIETIYSVISTGVLECRQSFLYGPFCSIYGVGSVALVLILKSKFSKNNHSLFWGGVLIGSVTEYLVSLIGEVVLNAKWWDYSDKFLNINGRICLIYSLFWGLLALYLIKVVNPAVDRFIDLMAKTFHPNLVKAMVGLCFIFLVVDAMASSLAINYFTLRVAVEHDLDVPNKEEVLENYSLIYNERPEIAEFIYKYWGDEVMIMTYPNLTITLANGDSLPIRLLYPELPYCYFNFNDYVKNKYGDINLSSFDIVVDKKMLL